MNNECAGSPQECVDRSHGSGTPNKLRGRFKFIIQRVDLKRFEGALRQSCLTLNKMVYKRERKALYLKENVFSDPERVYTSIIALSFLFSPLCITHDPCLPARTAAVTAAPLRTKAIEAREHWINVETDGRGMLGLSRSRLPRSEQLWQSKHSFHANSIH